MRNEKGEMRKEKATCRRFYTPHGLSPFSFNPALRSFPPSHLGNSSKLDCTRFGVGSHFSFN